MALPTRPNVTVDVYRGYDPAFPNPAPGTAAAVDVPGHLRHAVQEGRFGYQAVGLAWTNVLLVGPGVDVRDGYGGQLAGGSPADADAVLVRDYPIAGRCTAFRVVLAQRRRDARRGSYQEVRLDRARPRIGSCTEPRCCSGVTVPTTLKVTLAGAYCSFAAGTQLAITYDAVQALWVGSTTAGGRTLTARLRCNASALVHELSLACDGVADPYAGPDCGYTCSPFVWCRSGVAVVTPP